MDEQDKIVKAKKQLVITGVICIMVVIFTLWLFSLRSTITNSIQRYTSPFNTVQKAQQEQPTIWKQLKKTLP